MTEQIVIQCESQGYIKPSHWVVAADHPALYERYDKPQAIRPFTIGRDTHPQGVCVECKPYEDRYICDVLIHGSIDLIIN